MILKKLNGINKISWRIWKTTDDVIIFYILLKTKNTDGGFQINVFKINQRPYFKIHKFAHFSDNYRLHTEFSFKTYHSLLLMLLTLEVSQLLSIQLYWNFRNVRKQIFSVENFTITNILYRKFSIKNILSRKLSDNKYFLLTIFR